MANPNAPFGFKPLMVTLSGGPCAVTEYAKPASDGQAIFMFDLVNKVAASVPSPTSPIGLPVAGIQSEYTGTPGTTLIAGASLNYGAASKATAHYVVDSPAALFMAQVKTGTAITVASHIGKNGNVSKSTAGSTATKLSGLAVDGATIDTTNTLDVRLYKISNISPNAEGDSAIVEVVINKHALAYGSAGV